MCQKDESQNERGLSLKVQIGLVKNKHKLACGLFRLKDSQVDFTSVVKVMRKGLWVNVTCDMLPS